MIWSSPLSDYHRVTASNQFAMLAMSYFIWTQHWPVTELRQVDRDARKIITEGGGKHPFGTTSLLYLPGMFEIYEQLLPTRLYAIHKTQASPNSDPTCRLCGTAPESMAHILSACPALAQTKYLARHDAVLKVLFFDNI